MPLYGGIDDAVMRYVLSPKLRKHLIDADRLITEPAHRPAAQDLVRYLVEPVQIGTPKGIGIGARLPKHGVPHRVVLHPGFHRHLLRGWDPTIWGEHFRGAPPSRMGPIIFRPQKNAVFTGLDIGTAPFLPKNILSQFYKNYKP